MTTSLHSLHILLRDGKIEAELLFELGRDGVRLTSGIAKSGIEVIPLRLSNAIPVLGDGRKDLLLFVEVPPTYSKTGLYKVPRCIVPTKCSLPGVDCYAAIWCGLLIIRVGPIERLGNILSDFPSEFWRDKPGSPSPQNPAWDEERHGVFE